MASSRVRRSLASKGELYLRGVGRLSLACTLPTSCLTRPTLASSPGAFADSSMFKVGCPPAHVPMGAQSSFCWLDGFVVAPPLLNLS